MPSAWDPHDRWIIEDYPKFRCPLRVVKIDQWHGRPSDALIMKTIQEIRVATNCGNCLNKCCSQPFDWVYLTEAEIQRIEQATGRDRSEFVVERRNPTNGFTFKTLDLPCKFLASEGTCSVYDARPLICQLYPIYADPLTGHACLLPALCGDNLDILPGNAALGWSVGEFESTFQAWLKSLWREAAQAT